MGLNELNKILVELRGEQVQTQTELDGLTFNPNFSSLEALVEGYEQTQEKKEQLVNRTGAYKEIEKLLIEEIKLVEDLQAEAQEKKDAASLRKKEKYYLDKLAAASAKEELSPQKTADILANLASIRQEIRAKEVS